jgi:glucose/arabinose dehydrogenase
MHRLIVIVATAALLSAAPAYAQLRAQLVTGGFTSPLGFVQDPTQPNVQFVVEQGGRIRPVVNGVIAADFLNLSAVISSGGERGLLGLAFAPDYATSRRFFVNFTNPNGDTVVARFLRDPVNPLVAVPTSRKDLVWPDNRAVILQPFANHNGGNLMFGPDGFLYIGLGDGGSGGDPGNRAQDPLTLLGKMLRIDVNVPDSNSRGYVVPPSNPFVGNASVLPEIWAFGLRNPWRYSFDDPARGGTGALVIADVGQNAWEEVDYQPAGRGGLNYGWRIREGAHNFDTSLPPFSTPLTEPIFEYPHPTGNSITGGFVYRGNSLGSAFRGRYFFADIITNRVWSIGLAIDPVTGFATANSLIEHTAELGAGANSVSSFGVDASGELYLVSLGGGSVYRLGGTGLKNGTFSAGLSDWLTFATPNPSFFVGGVTNGVMEFFRVPAPQGTVNQAVILQPTGTSVPASTGLTVQVDLGNSSTVRKRLSVVLHDEDFSDLSVCTFWLAPGAPLQSYTMSAHTTQFWSNLTIAFYAATEGSDGGNYRLDNVVVGIDPAGSATETRCGDPTAPAPGSGVDSPELLTNGDFQSGLAPWQQFGQIQSVLTNGIFMFVRPPGDPAGGILQDTGLAVPARTILTASLDLGNSSMARRRVTVLVHDLDFSDLTVCTFWLRPGQPLARYFMRTYTTTAWERATVSVYSATIETLPWVLVDNISLRETPSQVTAGTECEEPGSSSANPAASAMLAAPCEPSGIACSSLWSWLPSQPARRPRRRRRFRRNCRCQRATSMPSPRC